VIKYSILSISADNENVMNLYKKIFNPQ